MAKQTRPTTQEVIQEVTVPVGTEAVVNGQVRLIGAATTGDRTGLSRWTLWRHEAAGKFPRHIKVGTKTLWIESEVNAWIAARIAERG